MPAHFHTKGTGSASPFASLFSATSARPQGAVHFHPGKASDPIPCPSLKAQNSLQPQPFFKEYGTQAAGSPVAPTAGTPCLRTSTQGAPARPIFLPPFFQPRRAVAKRDLLPPRQGERPDTLPFPEGAESTSTPAFLQGVRHTSSQAVRPPLPQVPHACALPHEGHRYANLFATFLSATSGGPMRGLLPPRQGKRLDTLPFP